MSKKYKKKNISIDEEDINESDVEVLSKKELYDLNKKKKDEEKKKKNKKKSNKKKKSDGHQINLMGRIFAIIMLILMIGSVVASIASYIK